MIARIVYFGLLLFTFFPFVESSVALLLGIGYGLIFQNEFGEISKRYSKKLLNIAIIGLGLGLNLHEAISVSKDGFFLTFISNIVDQDGLIGQKSDEPNHLLQSHFKVLTFH